MKIASAQIMSTIGDVEGNLKRHFEMIKMAAQYKVELIAFPEMSITGYCREEGKNLAFKQNDKRLNPLKDLSRLNNIIIIAGAPILINDQLFIGSFIIKPNKEVEIYTKQYLHDGEEVFYKNSFDYNPVIELKDEKISLAICADIEDERHPKDAKKINSTIYIPSIFYSMTGIDEGHQTLSNYAKENSFCILMSNFCGEHWNIKAGGKSAFWNENGEKIANLDPENEGLLIAEKLDSFWVMNQVEKIEQ